MLTCEQTKGQSVFQHGLSVQYRTFELLDHLEQDTILEGWRLPTWFEQYRSKLIPHDRETVANYTLYHDCGKPFCRTVDEEGRAHFPDHANVSADVYLKATSDDVVANLIRNDMAIHTASAEEIAVLCSIWSIEDACTLLLAALAEIHSNAALFGGIESVSFKAKWKNVERRGKQIFKFYFGEMKS
jgi:hypothetical protein